MAEKIQEKVQPVDPAHVAEAIVEKMPKFTKVQLTQSKRYTARRDALNVLLDVKKQYSFAQVDAILKKFDEGVKA